MAMFHILFIISLAALLEGVAAKKKKGGSELTKLVDIQNKWKSFWNKAAVGVSVNNCKRDCGWKDLKEDESKLRTETVELVMQQPQFEASLAEFLALSHRGASPKDHGMQCQASQAANRDDYCVCVQEVGNWDLNCGKSKDKVYCHSFLKNICALDIGTDDEGDLDDFEDLEDTEERLRTGAKGGIGEVYKEKPSQTEEHLLRLQAAMTNLDNERKQLYEVHAESLKKGNKSVRPLLSNIDQRIKRQKDKILRDMEELINRREKEVVKEKEEVERGEQDYQKRLKVLLENEHEI